MRAGPPPLRGKDEGYPLSIHRTLAMPIIPAILLTLCGCSYRGATSSSTSSEAIRVSESGTGSGCTASVSVKETVNGRSGQAQRVGVTCGSVPVVKAQLIATAKKGL